MTLLAALLPLIALLGGCGFVRPDRIEGDTPQEVAYSLFEVQSHLDPDRAERFAQAITTLTLVVPDKNDARSIGYMSPQFARMVSGRSVDQVIALADTYRTAAPPY